MLYFGYGSNLNLAEYRQWCSDRGIAPGALVPQESAVLPGMRLCFNYRSLSRNGAALNIVEAEGKSVAGMLFEVDATGIEALDQKEGVGDGRYERYEVLVRRASGATTRALTYRVTAQCAEAHALPPSDYYVSVVRAGLIAFALPTDHLDAAVDEAMGAR